MRALRSPLLLLSVLLTAGVHAQQWARLMQDPAVPFHQVRDAFNAHWEGRPYEQGKGWKVYKRWEWFMEPRTWPDGQRPAPDASGTAAAALRRMELDRGDRSAANWTPLGPESWLNGITGYNPGNGRINCIAQHPGDPATLYVGTPSGGLWRSTNAGGDWTPLFSDLPSLGVSGIAIDPTDPQVIYCATGDGDGADTYSMGVIKSTDGGATWQTTGLNWQTTATRTTRHLIMSPADPQVLLCATSNGVWRTEDGGTSWSQAVEGSFHDVAFKPDDPGVVYAAGTVFHRSVDGGQSFTPSGSGLPPAADVNRMRIAVTPADPFRVYVLCGSAEDAGFLGLYRSLDGGTGFTERSTSPNIFGYGNDGSDSGGQSGYDMALAADPTDANTIWAGGINVWKSTNGGSSWTNQSQWYFDGSAPYTHADIHSLDVYGGQLYCGSDGGIFRSADGGNSWTDLSSGLEITQLYRFGGSDVDPSLLIAGAQDNGMNLLDGGVWMHVLGADGMEGAIEPGDPTHQYGAYQNGGISRSDDGGQTFNNISFPITEEGGWVTPYVIDPQQPQRLIAGYENLWISEDRGDTWEQWTSFNTSRKVRAIAIAPGNSAVVYFANDSWMRRTINGGTSWTLVSNGLPDAAITSIAVAPEDPLHVYVSLSGFQAGQKVFESTDGGDTWTNISRNLPNVPANTLVRQSGAAQGLYVGTDIGVFYSDNTLSNWQPFSDGLPRVVVTELEVHAGAGKLRAATYGRGLWQSDLWTPEEVAPTAVIGHGALTICAGDPIAFVDLSLNAAPGSTWSFPGGTPATSTDPAPEVVYPNAGTYAVTLTVANAFGTDDATLDIPVQVLPNRLDIAITLDDYPGESSWTVVDANGADVLTGGPYTGLGAGSSVNTHACLAEGCYTFVMFDSYGDGICCSAGNGSFSVTNPQLGTIATGGAFDYTDATPFCVELSTTVRPTEVRPTLDARPLNGSGAYELLLQGAAVNGPLVVHDALGRTVRNLRWKGDRQLVDLSSEASGLYTVLQATDRGIVRTRLLRP